MTETAAYDSLNYNISNMSPKEPSIHGAALSLPDGALESIKGGPAYQLKWTNITKTVEVKDLSAGGLVGRSSLSLPAGSSESKVTGPATKTILHAVSGHAAPGQVLACMGASGAGKTSLMGVLSGRSSYQEGTLSINDKVLSKRDMKKLQTQIAYVKQKDVFFDHLTVRDQLTYTALLRLPKDLSTEDKHAEIEKIIHHLRLEKVADSPIMMVSGGERKRVNIGTELLTNPLIILLDEPTSGLDSTSAVRLLHLLQTFAKEESKTIITSIHQPSSAMFMSCFDQLNFLSEGHVVYFGTPRESLGYLETIGFPCPTGYNAADHWMDLLVSDTVDSVDDDALAEECDNDFSGLRFSKHATPRLLLQKAWQEGNAYDTPNVEEEDNGLNTETLDKYPTGWWEQYKILTHRALKNSRSSIFTWMNLFKSLCLGLVSGVLWFQLLYTEANVFDIRSYFFFTMTYWVIDSMYMALMAFPTERDVILKERSSGSYRLSAYFMAKTTADAPTRILLPFLYMFVSYWMAGIDKSFTVFIGTVGCTLLSVMAGEAFGLFIGAAMYDMERAMTALTIVALFLMLVGGFFVEDPPAFIAWGKYLSPFKYAFDSSTQLIFRQPLLCDGSGAMPSVCPPGSEGTYASGPAVIEALGIQGSIGFNVGLLIFLSLFPRYLAYLCLRFKKEAERA